MFFFLALARQFVNATVAKQKMSFKKLGIMADWDNCYHSFDKKYNANQLRAFFNMFEKVLFILIHKHCFITNYKLNIIYVMTIQQAMALVNFQIQPLIQIMDIINM